MNEQYADGESGFFVVIFDLAEIIPLAERTQHLRTEYFLCGEKEVSMAEEDLAEGGAVVET